MKTTLIGKRKFILCIFTILVFATTIYMLALTDSDFSLGAIEIGALGAGVCGIIGLVIYGYKQEYKEK